MKLIFIGCYQEKEVNNFRVRSELKNFIKRFDKVEEEERLMKVPVKSTIYWDYCPYDMDVGNGKHTFVWGLDREELNSDIHDRGQEV